MISKRVPHPPLVPAEAGTQALLHKLGSRFRGNERWILPYITIML